MGMPCYREDMTAGIFDSISRRELMRRALCAGAGLLVSSVTPGAEREASDVITKPIPSSGERVPVIGIGTIWFRDAQYPQLKAVLERMSALVGTLIDTAAAYGESEGASSVARWPKRSCAARCSSPRS